MAYYNNAQLVTLPASGALTQFTFGSVDSDGQVAETSAGAMPAGVIWTDADSAGEATELAIAGILQALAGESITAGDDLAVGSDGKARTATSGDVIVGKAVGSASGDGSVFSMLFMPKGAAAA